MRDPELIDTSVHCHAGMVKEVNYVPILLEKNHSSANCKPDFRERHRRLVYDADRDNV